MIDLGVAAASLLLALLAGLPSPSFVAGLVLATRFPRLGVWLGGAAAFAVLMIGSVLVAAVVSALPTVAEVVLCSLAFLAVAVVLFREGLVGSSQAKEDLDAAITRQESSATITHMPVRPGFVMVLTTSFTTFLLAHRWPIIPILAAALGARTSSPISSGVGGWLGLVLLVTVATMVGGYVQDRVTRWRVRLIPAVASGLLALWSLLDAARG